jgi:rhodanese-related sulfurtransferase
LAAKRPAPQQLELRVNDPTQRILVCCELGRIFDPRRGDTSQMGFLGAVALDGGMKAWRDAGIALPTD